MSILIDWENIVIEQDNEIRNYEGKLYQVDGIYYPGHPCKLDSLFCEQFQLKKDVALTLPLDIVCSKDVVTVLSFSDDSEFVTMIKNFNYESKPIKLKLQVELKYIPFTNNGVIPAVQVKQIL